MGVRKEFLFILLVLFFVSLAGVTAGDADNLTDDVLSVEANDDTLKVDATDNVASVDTKNNNDSISVAEIENDENNNQSDSKLKSEVIDQSSSADENDVLGAPAERDLLGRSLDDLKSDINRNSGLTQDYSGGNVNGKITFGSETIYSAKSDGSKIVMDFDGYSY
ncbi:MAG: hypothetical protein Q4Q37_06950, partial [Methanobrevibacter sp.]|nr:hypothetical protein [Methanobrevibacter sp.]